MTKFKNILSEGISEILYHKTNINSLLGILNTDTFNLTPVVGTRTERKFSTKMYYGSFMRSKTSGYGKYKDAFLEIDGAKLESRIKGHPIDYWSNDHIAGVDSNVIADKELEDRVFSDRPTIPNFTRYIIGIGLHTDGKPFETFIESYRNKIFQIVKACKKNNIPLLIFKSINKYQMYSFSKGGSVYGNSSYMMEKYDAININEIIRILKRVPEKDTEDVLSLDRDKRSLGNAERRLGNSTYRRDTLRNLLELFYGNTINDLTNPQEAWNLIDDPTNPQYDFGHTELDSILKNVRFSNDRYVKRLFSRMNSVGVRDGKGLVTYLYKKWKPSLEKYIVY